MLYLLRRKNDPDGRLVWLHPTVKGTRLLHEGRRRRVAALAADLAALDLADRQTLAAAADILERILQPPAAPRAAGDLRKTGRVRR